VGLHIEVLVDRSRSTPVHGSVSLRSERVLNTTILYPAHKVPEGQPVPNGSPDRTDGPYPLIVFAQGFGGVVSTYLPLLEHWAANGFVVAAPQFPVTGGAPDVADLSDYVHQPGDMSFVVTQLLRQSSDPTGLLSGLIDPTEVGAAGWSLGGVTTFGLVANTCCRDPRIKAAVVMSGDAVSFPKGRVEEASATPILFVHGDSDTVVPYASTVDDFNHARTPKGLLTIDGGSHDAPVNPADPAFSSVIRTTSDFFDGYLREQRQALGRLQHDAQPGLTALTFAARPGRNVRLLVPKATTDQLHAAVQPSHGLRNGQYVAVSWEGFDPTKTISLSECSTNPPTGPDDCDLSTADLLQPDPAGKGTLDFPVTTGVVGTGRCDATHPPCVVVVNEGQALAPSASVIVPIFFAG